jgi:tetratricopeptide (TPR) repeat protein
MMFAARNSLLLSLLLAGAGPIGVAAQPSLDACFSTDAGTPLDIRIDSCTSAIQSGGLSQDRLSTAFQNRGAAYIARGDNSRAIEDYGWAIRLDPGNANALNGRCWLRAASGQLQAALADCNESLRLRPNSSNSLDSRAFVYILLGRWGEAITDSDAALRANPKNAYALFERGFAKLRKGDPAGGNADVAASRVIDSKAEIEFAGLGVKL